MLPGTNGEKPFQIKCFFWFLIISSPFLFQFRATIIKSSRKLAPLPATESESVVDLSVGSLGTGDEV